MSAPTGRLVTTVPEVFYPAQKGTKSGGGCPIQTSIGAFGTASGTSAMCIGLQRQPKAGGTESLKQERKTPQGHQLQNYCRYSTLKLSAPAKEKYRLGKMKNRVRHERYVASLDQLPETMAQRGTCDSQREKETRGLAKARQRGESGPKATEF